jgi:Uma2 family endonuclease
MVATAEIPAGEYVPTADQRVILANVSWEHYEVQLALRADKSVPRLAYLEGAMELMSPSKDHERITSYLGRLIEVFAEEHEIEISPYRSWTLKTGSNRAGGEPDECYIVGADQAKDRPDFVIEVVWTSGGIDKLEVYSRLGIAEVWFWIDGKLQFHVLRAGSYERAAQSSFLPGLDPELLCSFLDRRSLHVAKRDYRAALHARR